jgi:HEPN superfamily AbiU2-like protein
VLFEHFTTTERIDLAKTTMSRVLDHFLYLMELHANNLFVVYSPTLASQIPASFAANAFNVFQRSMYQIEIVRLCAIWDKADPKKESIPTVVKMIDTEEIIEMLADEVRRQWPGTSGGVLNPTDDPHLAVIEKEAYRNSEIAFGNEQAVKTKMDLMQAISDAREILESPRLTSVVNARDKHLAHSLTQTRRETRAPVPPMRNGDETDLLNASIPIVEKLYRAITNRGFSIEDSQEIDQANAAALWNGCKFDVLR